jgi:hypothetical protein
MELNIEFPVGGYIPQAEENTSEYRQTVLPRNRQIGV